MLSNTSAKKERLMRYAFTVFNVLVYALLIINLYMIIKHGF